MNIVDRIIAIYEGKGDEAYLGEPVSQREHALQAAWAAEKEGASSALITAALVHDIGHLLHDLPENIAQKGVDTRHEDAGAALLTTHFGPEVTEPVRLHVASKRYLCAVDLDYQAQLSDASILSLKLQGGPFSPEEADAFASQPFAADAVKLRRWDDLAKIAGLDTPGLQHFRPHLEAAVA